MRELCRLLGWEEDLDALMAAGRAEFDQSRASSKAGGDSAAAAAAAVGGSSTEAVLRATAEAAVAAEAPEPAGEAAVAEAKPEAVAVQAAL